MTIYIPLIFLVGSTALTGITKSLSLFGLISAKKEFEKRPRFYFFPLFLNRLFQAREWDSLFFLASSAKQICRLVYAVTGVLFISDLFWVFSALIIIGVSLICDLSIRMLATAHPKFTLRLMILPATLFLLVFFPLTYCLLSTQKLFKKKTPLQNKTRLKEKILELVHESEMGDKLSPLEQKLITSVASFKDRIVREVMVPRINLFSLPASETIEGAAKKFIEEGYSRIPVYKDTIDKIIGVVFYKDLLTYFLKSENKDAPIETLVKPIIYAPETKKISSLLQEFRSKQIHMAIVVDEYGGTEGIVSIEDILEELVGEIADEYDTDEEALFIPHPEGGYILDGRMSILDIERELGVTIPSAPEYDTIGGYIFHKAGTIPSKGFRVHHDNFDIEVISCTDRLIEKVLLLPKKEK